MQFHLCIIVIAFEKFAEIFKQVRTRFTLNVASLFDHVFKDR